MYSAERQFVLSGATSREREQEKTVPVALGATKLLEKFSKLSSDKKSAEESHKIFTEQKSIESMVQSLIGDIINSAESQGRVNVSAKYDQYKAQMEKAKSEMKKLSTQFNYLI